MPYRRSTTRRPKGKPRKKVYKKKPTYKVARPIFTYANNIGLGSSRRAKLTFRWQQTLSAAAGAPASFSLYANSCYDPVVAVGGHQPFGFDQLIALYKTYRVSYSTVQCRFSNSGSNNAAHICQVLYDNDNTVDTNMNTRLERTKGLGSKLLLTNSNNTQVVTSKASTAHFFKVKDISDDHQLSGTSATSPTKPMYAHIIVQCADNASATTNAVLCEVLLTQWVTFFDPEEQSGS